MVNAMYTAERGELERKAELWDETRAMLIAAGCPVTDEQPLASIRCWLKARLGQSIEQPDLAYGTCPHCGAAVIMRERRLNGNDRCASGHTYPSKDTIPN